MGRDVAAASARRLRFEGSRILKDYDAERLEAAMFYGWAVYAGFVDAVSMREPNIFLITKCAQHYYP